MFIPCVSLMIDLSTKARPSFDSWAFTSCISNLYNINIERECNTSHDSLLLLPPLEKVVGLVLPILNVLVNCKLLFLNATHHYKISTHCTNTIACYILSPVLIIMELYTGATSLPERLARY